MRDARRIQEHLGARSQIVWLTLGGMVAIGITFALGVMVGRRAEKLAQAQHEAPADPLKRIDDERKIQDELTYYARLTQPKGDHFVASPLPSKKTKAPDTTQLVATDAVDSTLFAPPPVAPVAPVAAKPEPAQIVVAQAPTPAAQPKPAAAEPIKAPVVSDRAGADAAKDLHSGRATTGQYTIQVSSFQTADEANAYAGSLKRKGYSPYVVSTQIAGKGTWYRVRVGAFATSDAANAAKQQLMSNDIAGWVVKSE